MYTNNTFMGRYSTLVYACILTLLLAAFIINRIDDRARVFNKTVTAARNVSHDYDRSFLDIVNYLETTLAERAQFGYAGERDPMTGATRTIAQRPVAPARTSRTQTPAQQATPVRAAVDPVRLTAIIFDNSRSAYTAIIMEGTRSLSVEVGDVVAGNRRVTRVTREEIHMESASERFVYHIMGDVRRESR